MTVVKEEIQTVAIHNLQDDITELERVVGHLEVLQQEIVEEYFDKYNPMNNNDDRTLVAWGYSRYGVFADMVQQKINEVCKITEKLKQKVDLD